MLDRTWPIKIDYKTQSMKSQKNNLNTFSDKELAESFVLPSKQTDKQRLSDARAIQKLREKATESRSDENALIFQLLQLKFRMEDYLKSSSYDIQLSFGYFLREYVLLVSKKQKDFAQEISIKPTELSQIINSHRRPPYGFVIRLEIHSNSAISAISWNRLLEKENEFELIHNKSIWKEERKHVKSRLRVKV